jgi:flagellar motor protein MotB
MTTRHLLLVPLLSVLALGGCRMRGEGPASTGPEDDNESAATSSLQAQVNALTTENASLKTSLEAARANMDAGPTLGSKGIAGADVEGFTRTAEGGLALPDDFAFAKGSAELNEEGKKAVGRLAERLNQGENAGKKVLVKGFTDDTPVSRASTKEKYVDNWGLSAARSAAVVRALEKAGISSERLVGGFRGQLDPRASGAEDKAKNRRVEIYLNG